MRGAPAGRRCKQAQGSGLQLLELGDLTTGSRETETQAVAFPHQPGRHNLDSRSHGPFLSLRIFTVQSVSGQSQMAHVSHVTLSRATTAGAPDGWHHLLGVLTSC